MSELAVERPEGVILMKPIKMSVSVGPDLGSRVEQEVLVWIEKSRLADGEPIDRPGDPGLICMQVDLGTGPRFAYCLSHCNETGVSSSLRRWRDAVPDGATVFVGPALESTRGEAGTYTGVGMGSGYTDLGIWKIPAESENR